MQWRERIWLLAFYPLDEIKKRSYSLGLILFVIIVLGGSSFFHAANTDVIPEIVPGMQVTVDIIGGKRTVLGYILSPIERATAVAFREK